MNIFYKRPCNYEIGDLDKMIFIENRQREYIETDTKNQQLLHIDNSTNLYKIDCDSVKLEENTSFDNNRFQFNYTLTVVLSETKNHSYLNTLDLLQKGDWLIYVKTNDNQYYCVNYEFKPKMTYDCEWSDSNTNVTITFGMNQNIPVLRIDDWVNPNVSYLFQKQCDYSRPKIEVFETIYAKNIDVQRTSDFSFEKIVTRDSFNEVYPLNNSFSFHHVFNGDEYQDTITFDVTRLKSDNPIHESFEFKENVYVVKFDVNGFTYIVGLDEGLFPSYSYSTETDLNKQTITLTRTTNYGILASINYESHKDLTDRVEDYRKPTITIGDEIFSAWKCVSPTMSVRLMIPQVSSSGVKTNKYYVLEGYEDYYSNLDVIGTYTVNTVYNFGVEAYQYSEICKDFGKCYINTSLSSVNNMYGSTLTFAIDAPCGWKIYDYDDCLSFSRLSGEGSTTVIITSTCDYDADTSFKIGSDDIENVYHIIRKEGVECFIKPNTKNITASAQTVQFEVDNIDASRIGLIANPDIVTINAIGTKINVEVPQYTDEIKPRIIEIKGAYGGKLCSVNIVQDHIHISWKDKVGDYICENGNKYQTQQKWSGYTATDINTPLNETRKGGLIELSSSDCTDADIWWFDTDEYTCEDIDNPDGYEYLKWIPTTETLCDGKDKYRIEVLHGSHDNINWHPMSRERQGDLLERNSTDCMCERMTKWEDDEETIMYDEEEDDFFYTSYLMYSDDCGQTWIKTSTNRKGELVDPCLTIIKWLNNIGIRTYRVEGWLTREQIPEVSGWIVNKIRIGNCVTHIEDGFLRIGFAYEGYFNSLKIPDSVVYIGYRAFSNCRIETLNLGNGVKDIGEEAFWSNDYLTAVTIPDSVIHLGEHAFAISNCESGLTHGTSAKNLKTITIGSGLTNIPYGAFEGHEYVETIIIADGVTKIDCRVFNMSHTKNLTIPSSVTEICDTAFYHNGSIFDCTDIYPSRPENVYCSKAWFYNNEQLIKQFAYCNKYWSEGENISVIYYNDGSVSTYDGDIPTEYYKGNNNINKVVISNNITVGANAFEDCTNLTELIFENNATINDSAFQNCINLNNIRVNYPYGRINIGSDVFNNIAEEGVFYTNNSCYVPLVNSDENIESLGNVYNWRKYYSQYDNVQQCQLIYRTDGQVDFFDYMTGDTSVKRVEDNCGHRIWYNGATNLETYLYTTGTTQIISLENCYKLKDFVILDSITWIDGHAFKNCDSLTSITIPNSVETIAYYTFENCDKLQNITFNNSLVPDFACKDCSSLTEVYISHDVTKIGQFAFQNCNLLQTITYDGTLAEWNAITKGQYWDKDLNYRLICLQEQDCAYTASTDITIVYYTNDIHECLELTSLGTRFSGNTNINKVEIGDTITTIGDKAFYGCTNLTSVTIPDSVTSIGTTASATYIGAFYNCKNLKTITIPNSVETIGGGAFNTCQSLSSVTIPSSVTSIGNRAFYNCTNLSSVTIPSSVTSIGDSAFNGCESLTEIEIPSSITSISSAMLYSCRSLTSVTIPDSVTTIGDNALYNCKNLTELTIPVSVTKFGKQMLMECTRLSTLNYNGTIAQWNAITKGSDWKGGIAAKVVHCTDGNRSIV